MNAQNFILGFMSIFAIIGTGIIIGFFYSGEPVMLAVGTLFSIGGWTPVIFIIRQKQIQASVKAHGRLLETTFVAVLLSDLTMNDRATYTIQTEWLDVANNTLYYFKSNLLWKDPTALINPDNKIFVKVDPNNFMHNYMDLSFLPESFGV